MDYNSTTGPAAGIFAFLGLIIIFSSITGLLSVIALWKLFVKAGKPGWASIIPIYNLIVMVEIVGKPTIWILWLIFPCTSWFFSVWLINLFMKSFGKEEGYTIGVILLPFIFLPLLAFGNNPYLGPSAAEAKKGFQPNDFGSNNPFTQPPTTPQA
ncbi:MAG TPA: DUF5684 domain-containing protein [Pedobacter sp.]